MGRKGFLVLLGLWATAAAADAPTLIYDLTNDDATAGFSRYHGSTGRGTHGTPVTGGYDCDGDGFPDSAFAGIRTDPVVDAVARDNAGEVTLVFGDGTIGGVFDTAGFQSNILKIAGDQDCEVAGAEIWMDDVTGDGLGDLLICRQNYSPPSRSGAGALTINAAPWWSYAEGRIWQIPRR